MPVTDTALLSRWLPHVCIFPLISLLQSSFPTLGLGTSCLSASDALTLSLSLSLADSYLFFEPQLKHYFTKTVFPALLTHADPSCVSSLYSLHETYI